MSIAIGIMNSIVTSYGPSYDPAASALFARFTTPPTPLRARQVNDLFLALRNSAAGNLLLKFDALYIFAAADSQAATRNWVQNLYNATAVASPTFTADQGFAGNGTSSYLTSGFTPSSAPSPKYTQNSAHLSAWSRTDNDSSGVIIGGRTGGSVSQALVQPRASNLFHGRLNQNASGAGIANTNSSGHLLASRVDSANRKAYRNGVSLGALAEASDGVPNTPIFIGALNGGAGTAAAFDTRQMAAASIGGTLSDAEALAFYNALQAYMTAVGA